MHSTFSAPERRKPTTVLRTDELDYHLPPEMIATRPAVPRDSARMLVLWRSQPSRPAEHRHVSELPEFLQYGDTLAFNNTAVVPARFMGRRSGTGGRVEGLFLEECPGSDHHPQWRVMLKAGGKLHPGDRIELTDHDDRAGESTLKLVSRADSEWIVRLVSADTTPDVLNRFGWTPLPPYILKARGTEAVRDDADRQWYQTVFADPTRSKSVAAPTAGLHFTQALLDRIRAMGAKRIDVTLHVGAGTFKPVAATNVEQHPMHAELFEVSPSAVREFRSALQSRPSKSGRLLAVGTTTVRTLESLADWLLSGEHVIDQPVRGQTSLLITPPYEFKVVDGMLTNFHLPRSTLLALVAAMVGLERLKTVYREAIDRGYRFYSYGDAMLILP